MSDFWDGVGPEMVPFCEAGGHELTSCGRFYNILRAQGSLLPSGIPLHHRSPPRIQAVVRELPPTEEVDAVLLPTAVVMLRNSTVCPPYTKDNREGGRKCATNIQTHLLAERRYITQAQASSNKMKNAGLCGINSVLYIKTILEGENNKNNTTVALDDRGLNGWTSRTSVGEAPN
ncbi:hypothetical protein EVAR_38172_1 [Eumeta japonica]|uniref:Uncharacterized protein n=1 Tax=Eumeta variegata TaxID=151549 RepID=A0A4C1WGY2_EUMVA|nr:hypothetical protein EVAR_38172_1 [Eumeta japonica]